MNLSPEEQQKAQAFNKAIQVLAQLAKLLGAESDVCPHCQQTAKPLRQVGRCIYGACGCRICQGALSRGNKKRGAP